MSKILKDILMLILCIGTCTLIVSFSAVFLYGALWVLKALLDIVSIIVDATIVNMGFGKAVVIIVAIIGALIGTFFFCILKED